jgi:hypothetical protein
MRNVIALAVAATALGPTITMIVEVERALAMGPSRSQAGLAYVVTIVAIALATALAAVILAVRRAIDWPAVLLTVASWTMLLLLAGSLMAQAQESGVPRPVVLGATWLGMTTLAGATAFVAGDIVRRSMLVLATAALLWTVASALGPVAEGVGFAMLLVLALVIPRIRPAGAHRWYPIMAVSAAITMYLLLTIPFGRAGLLGFPVFVVLAIVRTAWTAISPTPLDERQRVQ